MAVFSQLSGSLGHDVLYVGDHIFSDVIVSKKQHRWRNLLVVRELERELTIQESPEATQMLKHLENLNFVFREIYRGTDSASTEVTDISLLRKHIKKTVATLNQRYNELFGSLFPVFFAHTFFYFYLIFSVFFFTSQTIFSFFFIHITVFSLFL
jgi:5'-nucleotidase